MTTTPSINGWKVTATAPFRQWRHADGRRAQELLRAAARDIEAALTRLDTSGDEHDCSACGVRHKHYRNMTHARTFEQLTGTPDKLRRLAERIEQTAPIAAPSQKEK